MTADLRLRRRPTLRVRFRGSGFVVDSPELSRAYEMQLPAMRILSLCELPVARNVLVEWADLESDAARALIDNLEREGLLVATEEQLPTPWDRWGLAAWFAHWEGARTRFLHVEEEVVALKQDILLREPPALTTTRHRDEGLPVVELEPVTESLMSTPLNEILVHRRTARFAASNPSTIDQVSAVVGATFASQGKFEAGQFGDVHMKSYPAAGGRHDLDAYVLVFDVEGLASGTYWYDDEYHSLRRIGPTPDRSRWDLLTGAQGPLLFASFACVTVSVTARLAWKYRSPRTYRDVWQHTGHAVQVLQMAATSAGLESFITGAFSDHEVQRELGLEADEWPTFVVAFNGEAKSD
ncbi:SagB/ThcOx family dehydrogenase [Microbacterium paludicola]|uniref:SagB/ThcOx family dehydrogenase n=1 Tax=Microbacterium paludicola TaxID=300019 RepID=UPI00387933B7